MTKLEKLEKMYEDDRIKERLTENRMNAYANLMYFYRKNPHYA